AHKWNAENGPKGPESLGVRPSVFRVFHDIGNLHNFAFNQRPSNNRSSPRLNRNILEEFNELIRQAVESGPIKELSLLPGNNATVCLAKSYCRFDQRIEHRLQIERRTTDHLEHIRSRRLLLQGFA